VAFIARLEEKFVHRDEAINDYLSLEKSAMEYLSRHHQEHCRLNKDGGNEAESRRETMNLEK
jgi:hypothetical protein